MSQLPVAKKWSARIKGLILDRDGTIVEHVPYLSCASEVRLLPGLKDGLRQAVEAKLLLFLHTNQSGVGRGYFEMDKVIECNNAMVDLLGCGAAPFSRICIATESPDCARVYRKPSPRFAQEIMKEFDLRPEELCYIGDRASDMETALAAGTFAIGVATGGYDLAGELREIGLQGAFPLCNSFAEAMQLVLERCEERK